MRVVNIRVGANGKHIRIGRRGENGATQVVFDVTDLVATCGDGACVLMAKRPNDTAAYPVAVTREGNAVTWLVSEVDTQFRGAGEAELFWYVGDTLAKTVIYTTVTGRAIEGAPAEAPDPYETWLDTLTDLAADTLAAAADARTAAQTAQGIAESAREAAESAREAASVSQSAAASSASDAASDAAAAADSAASASASASGAAGSAAAASASAERAAASASASASGAAGAENAKTAAQAAQSAAETAQAAAEAAGDAAAAAADQAERTLGSYARTDGSYADMTVGSAGQLVATVGVTDRVPYCFRTSGGSADIGDREADRIIGGTVVWNQLADAAAAGAAVQSGHRYVACIGGVWSMGTGSDAEVAVPDGSVDMVFDLTRMFGSAIADYVYGLEQANAGAGIAWFRKLFPKTRYAYNAGGLMSVQAASHRTVGFNAWDEQWEPGGINPNTGIPYPTESGTRIRSRNFIPVVPNAPYNISFGGIRQAKVIVWYDADKNYLSGGWSNADHETAPGSARFMKFTTSDAYGNTYKKDICFHLAWDGERDGEYEPYAAHEYPLDDSLILRGIPRLDANRSLCYDGDAYDSDGTVTRRFGVVTVDGTVNTVVHNGRTDAASNAFFTGAAGKAPGSGFLADRFVTGGTGPFTASGRANNGGIEFRLPPSVEQTDAALNQWFSEHPTTVVYELADPVCETAAPYQNPQIVDDFGTEEYVDAAYGAGMRDVAIPTGHETVYQANLRAKLEMAPDSPDGDGLYVVKQTGGENSYVPLVIPTELPAGPSGNGTYTLKATVSGGTTALSWEAVT